MDIKVKEKLMAVAIEEAQKAIDSGNSPFGAVLCTENGDITDIAHNTINTDGNPLAHAEINLILKATKRLKTKDLSNFTLVCNAQSCPMCFSACIKAKISSFIFGCGEDWTLKPKINVFELSKYCEPKPDIETGILRDECLTQLNKFRENKK